MKGRAQKCSHWLGRSEPCVPSAHLCDSSQKGLSRAAESLLLSLRGAGVTAVRYLVCMERGWVTLVLGGLVDLLGTGTQ